MVEMKKGLVIFGLFLLFLAVATLYMTLSDPYTNILEGTLFFGLVGTFFLLAGLFPGKK